jgi:hypothetical protein
MKLEVVVLGVSDVDRRRSTRISAGGSTPVVHVRPTVLL